MTKARACECCERASHPAGYYVYDPACAACGARYYRHVGSLREGKRLEDWRAHIVATWARYGHRPQDITGQRVL